VGSKLHIELTPNSKLPSKLFLTTSLYHNKTCPWTSNQIMPYIEQKCSYRHIPSTFFNKIFQGMSVWLQISVYYRSKIHFSCFITFIILVVIEQLKWIVENEWKKNFIKMNVIKIFTPIWEAKTNISLYVCCYFWMMKKFIFLCWIMVDVVSLGLVWLWWIKCLVKLTWYWRYGQGILTRVIPPKNITT